MSVKKVSVANPSFSLRSVVFDALLLFVSFSISFNARFVLRLLPHGEHYGIEGVANMYPEANYLLILLVCATTLGIFWLLKKIQRQSSTWFRVSIITLFCISLTVGVIAPSVSRYEHNIDTFHNGEQLGPALGMTQGKTPYKDMYILHGAGEDAITPWLSFKLFGKSIGSYYLLPALLQIASAGLFLYLIHKLFSRDTEFLLVSLWFMLNTYGGFYVVHDIFVWITLLLIYKAVRTHRFKASLLIPMGGLASLALFYSFDRGLFLGLLLTLFTAFVLFFRVDGPSGSLYVFSPKTYAKRLKAIACMWGGYVLGVLLFTIVFRPSGFAAFIKMNAEVLRYQGLMFNTPFPPLSSEGLLYWLPVFAIIAVALVLARRWRQQKTAWSVSFVFGLVLAVTSIIMFRAATGRPDLGHIAYASSLVFLAVFYTLFEVVRDKDKPYSRLDNLHYYLAQVWPLVAVLVLMFLPPAIDYYRLAQMNQTSLHNLKIMVKAPTEPDGFWYSRNVQEITDAVKRNTNQNDYFYVFSSDPAFYYTTGLRNSTNFYISWFADPAPLEDQMLSELKANPPKVVLYQSGTDYDRPEFIPMSQRLPKINTWLLSEYTKQVPIGDTGAVLLMKN